MKLLIVLIASLASTLASPSGKDHHSLNLCSPNGNPDLWLSVEIRNNPGQPPVEFINTGFTGRQPGRNFCLGETGDGGFKIRMFSDPSCTVKAQRVAQPTQQGKSPLVEQDNVPCGGFDYDAPSCANFEIRQLARLIAPMSADAQSFVERFNAAVQNKDWAVGAVVYQSNAPAVVQQEVYTDNDICSMTLTIQNNQQLAFLAANLRPLRPRKYAQMPKQQPETRLVDCDRSVGFWGEAQFNGLDRASIAGQFRLGENFCIVSSSDTNQLNVVLKENLFCDTDADDRSSSITLTSHERDIIDEDGQCRFDFTNGQCVDDRLKAKIIETISESKDVAVIADKVFAHLIVKEGNTRDWGVLVTEMIEGEPFSISRTLRSDSSHCFVIYRAGEKTFAVMAAKTA